MTKHPALVRVPSTTERSVAVVAALLVLALVTYVDEVTGPTVGLDGLYILPTLVGSWYLGRRGGFFFAVLTTAAWSLVRLHGRDFPATGPGIHSWNALMELSVNGTIAYLLARAREQTYLAWAEYERAHRLPDVIPICAWCRKMRDAQEEWQTLEQFLSKETGVLLTHGICHDCAERVVRETHAEIGARRAATG